MTTSASHYNVVIIGAGLAGLSLAHQLLLTCNKTILLLEKRVDIPPTKQKVGESLVQVGGYYFSKVLDMEEYLLQEHYMKYNLRFYWKDSERDNDNFEDYSQAYIRNFSNIPCYQLDRNKIEGELLRRNQTYNNFTLRSSVKNLQVNLSDKGLHTIDYTAGESTVTALADWVVDTSGRSKYLERQLGLQKKNNIRHGASFFWVDGLVDIDKLTGLSPAARRLKQGRREIGHLPVWLATNHFMGEGFWFWVIPLQGITSFGLVYDRALFPRERVETFEGLMDWLYEAFPLFARELPQRHVLARGAYKDFSFGCEQTIDPSRWAISGEAGRFTDPLYSPGSDFIAIHNTLICDAIITDEARALSGKCRLYEVLMQSLYSSLLPTFATSYDALGNQETFILKYTWELSIYFSHFVFPFINDLMTERRFVAAFLSKFSRLGSINHRVQSYISAYYQWKKTQPIRASGPRYHDFMSLEPLRRAECMFYKVGLTVEEAKQALDDQQKSLIELARFIIAYINADVTGEVAALTNPSFVARINLQDAVFDPDAIRATYAVCAGTLDRYEWSFDHAAMDQFHLHSESYDGLTRAEAMSQAG